MRDLPGLIYDIKYRIKLTLGLYGYCYAIYPHHSSPEWPWYKYLLCDLKGRPEPIISFSDHEDAWVYLNRYPQLGLYIRRERYVP